MSQILKEKNLKIYLIYSLTFIVLGNIITGLGPLIPYLAFNEGHKQYEYSYLFMCRAVGFIFGSLLIKVADKYLKMHSLIIGSCAFSGFIIFFSFTSDLYLKGFLIFFSSIGSAWMDVTINVCVIELFQNNNLNFWMQMCHGAFGVGGLLGPFFVYQFQLNVYAILGTLCLLLIPFYIFQKSPEDKADEELNNKENQESQFSKTIQKNQIYLICVIFLFLVGQQSTFGGWISSFAVMSGYSTKQSATVYGSIYWGSITLFRFIFPFIEGKSSKKLFWLFITAVIGSILSLVVLKTINPVLGMVLGGIVLGIANSITFPQTMTLPNQFNYKLTTSVNSSFMFFAAIGDGVFPAFTGLLMKAISPDMLFYSMALLNAALLYLLLKTVESLKEYEEPEGRQKLLQLNEMKKNNQID